MKKLSLIRMMTLLLTLTVVTGCFVGGTLAKYSSSVSLAQDTVTVAAWQIEVNGKNISVSGDQPELSFDLFGSKDTIAPGDSGSFKLEVANKSAVPATYSISFNETNASSVPVKYTLSKDNTALKTAQNSLAALNISNASINGTDGVDTYTVSWEWPFDGDDTSFGIATEKASIAVSASINVEQAQ